MNPMLRFCVLLTLGAIAVSCARGQELYQRWGSSVPIKTLSIRALDKPTDVDITELSLADAIDYLGEFHGIPIRIDKNALAGANISLDDVQAPSMRLVSVPLRSVLHLLLAPAKLGCVLDAEGLLVTTQEIAEKHPDLVQPDADFESVLVEIPDARGFSAALIPGDEQTDSQPETQGRVRFSDRAFDGLIYGDHSGAKEAGERLDRLLQSKLNAIDRAANLNDLQIRKLKLAGRGDIKHWFDRVEQLRAKYRVVTDKEEARQLSVDAVPLRFLLQHGPFGEISMFQKTKRSLLAPEPLESRERKP